MAFWPQKTCKTLRHLKLMQNFAWKRGFPEHGGKNGQECFLRIYEKPKWSLLLDSTTMLEKHLINHGNRRA